MAPSITTRNVAPSAPPGDAPTGAKAKAARRSKSKRRVDDDSRAGPTGSDVDAETLEFIDALDRFKKQSGRPFPTWSEVLQVVKGLGYRKA